MRLRLGISFTLVACLAACQVVPVTPSATRPSTRPKTVPSTPVASPSASPSEAPVATATASPSTAPSASPSAPTFSKLKKPTGSGLTLSGKVQIDAHYLNATQAGGIISHNGSSLGVVGQATLIGNNGGTLISNNGGTVVSAGSGNVVSAGGLISDKGLGFKVTQLGGTAAVGAIMPVAGLEIRARNIADGQPLAIGENEEGKPVYAIYSNAEGAFELFLPSGINGVNVLVTANPPTGDDSRLRYERYVNQKVGAAEIDEETALITNYIREAFARQLDDLFIGEEGTSSSVSFLVPPEFQAAFETIEKRFSTAADSIKAREMPRAKRLVITRRAADAHLAFVDLEAVKFEKSSDLVLKRIAAGLKDIREASAAKLAAEPDFFKKQDYMIEANAGRAADEPPYEVLKPTDVGDFINRWCMSILSNATRRPRLERVLASIGAPAEYSTLLIDADFAITSASSLTLITEPKSADAVEKAILAGAP